MDINKINNLQKRDFKIYSLKCPITKEIRYIGVTVNTLNARLSQHIFDSKKGGTYKRNWIKSILDINKKPLIELVENCTYKNWEEREKYWIKYYDNLTNTSVGGVGLIINRTEQSKFKSIKAKYKSIIAISKDKTIKKYNSLKECSIDLNIPPSSITWVLRFPEKSAYNYHFVYSENYYSGYENTVNIKKKHERYNLIYDNKQYSKKELSILLNCSKSLIGLWCNGKRDYKKSKLLKNKILQIIKI